MDRNRALVRLARVVWLALRLFIPWLIRGLFVMIWLMWMAAVSIWSGFPTAVRRIASHWFNQSNFPVEWERNIYPIACVGAFLMIVVGWILNAYFTVWFLGRVF